MSLDSNVFVDPKVAAPALVQQDDILICVRNGSRALIGKCAQIDQQADGMAFGAFMSVYRTPFADFVFRQFQSAGMKRQIEQHLGATINQITNASLKSFKIPFTDNIEERQAIVSALRCAEDLIASLDALIAKKRDIKQAAMQQLLTGRTRLPQFSTTPIVKSEIGEIPEDWEVRSLASLGEPRIGLTYSPSDVRESGTLVLRSSNVQNGDLSFDDNVFVDSDAAARALVAEGDILICVRNGSRALIGKCAIIDSRAVGMAFGAFMSVFRSPHSSFLHHQFQSHTIQKQIHEHLGATINQITNASLRSFRVPFPVDSDERDAIVSVLSDMESEVRALEQKVSKVRHLREGMMQQLLTGRIRLA
ncbi:restriction endonuclease subunit S [Pontixanthobacter rizhaonensis]|uniref:restriction endonuclease subunit S n=1 Tax=Pontixanthobacter rizhaonensis TaxID=2730337 RepID=UPI0031B5FA9B